MKRIGSLGILAFAALANPALVCAAQSNVTVPAGDLIAVAMQQDIGSRTSRDGDTFVVVTTADYVVGGRVVLPKGSPGYGTITHIKGARRFHAGGEMTFTVDRLIEPNGNALPVATNGATADADKKTEKNGNLAGQVALSALLCKLCFLAKKGNDMLIARGSIFHVATIEQSGVAVAAANASPAPIDFKLVTHPPEPSPSP